MTLSSHVKDSRHKIINSSSFQHQRLLLKEKIYLDRGYTNFDEDFMAIDMQNQTVHRPVRKQSLGIPILPQRNALRTVAESKKELSIPKGVILLKNKELYSEPMLSSSDLHDVYLSSEEDVSVKDSNEDFLFDSDDSENDLQLKSYDRESQEITARAVSFRLAGKPQIIEINCHSKKSSPRASASISNHSSHRPLLPRLPVLSLTLSDFHLDAHELFPSSPPQSSPPQSSPPQSSPPQSSPPQSSPSQSSPSQSSPPQSSLPQSSPPPSSPPPLSTQKLADSLQSNALVKANFCKSYTDPTQLKPVLESSTPLSIFRRGSLLNKRSQITQSIIQISTHATKNSPTTTSKISGRLNALKYASRNIKNTGMPKISLAYTPGVVPRRT